jgi:hypothetical protein
MDWRSNLGIEDGLFRADHGVGSTLYSEQVELITVQ